MYLHAILALASQSEDRSHQPRSAKATLVISQPYTERSADGMVSQTFVVENQGSEDASAGAVTISAIAIRGERPAAFSMIDDQCSSAELSPGDACTVRIRFHSQAAARSDRAMLVVDVYDEGTRADGVTADLSDER